MTARASRFHRWYLCRRCKRYIGGCFLSCPGVGDECHVVHEVDCCIVCARGPWGNFTKEDRSATRDEA